MTKPYTETLNTFPNRSTDLADNILPFKRPSAKDKHKGKTLCRSGFHKWKVVTERKFDVKQGKLVTQYRCTRCGSEKVKAH